MLPNFLHKIPICSTISKNLFQVVFDIWRERHYSLFYLIVREGALPIQRMSTWEDNGCLVVDRTEGDILPLGSGRFFSWFIVSWDLYINNLVWSVLRYWIGDNALPHFVFPPWGLILGFWVCVFTPTIWKYTKRNEGRHAQAVLFLHLYRT